MHALDYIGVANDMGVGIGGKGDQGPGHPKIYQVMKQLFIEFFTF